MALRLESLLLQILVILIAARCCGWLLKRLGQPAVIGEMLAGILLGPTLLGRLNDGAVLQTLFPAETRPALQMLSQLGVILFMFLVGLELDLDNVVKQGRGLVRTAAASMVVPFGLGLLLAWILTGAGYGPGQGGTQTGFVVFVAIALSITAFPVLARILSASHLRQTQLAGIALTCAALNDVVGWCMLAALMGSQRVSEGTAVRQAVLMVGGVVLYVLLMFAIVRPWLRKLGRTFDARGLLSADAMALVFILLVGSAWATEMIGIHALFGAFVAGAVLPSGAKFVAHVGGKVQDLVTHLLVPLYFAYTGLNTQLGLLDSGKAWALAGLVTVFATVGKVGGTYLAARGPLGSRQALTLGVLMNTRGLMELIILNMALEVKAIDASVYAMMVVMTLITTAMTMPAIRRFRPATVESGLTATAP